VRFSVGSCTDILPWGTSATRWTISARRNWSSIIMRRTELQGSGRKEDTKRSSAWPNRVGLTQHDKWRKFNTIDDRTKQNQQESHAFDRPLLFSFSSPLITRIGMLCSSSSSSLIAPLPGFVCESVRVRARCSRESVTSEPSSSV